MQAINKIKLQGVFGRRLAGVLLALSLLALSGRALRADSMFGAPQLGVPVAPVDARSRGMGGVSVAITGEDFSFTNPARTINFWRSGFNAEMYQDFRTLKDGSGAQKLRSTEFVSFRGVFPTYKKFVVAAGIYQTRDMTWEFSDQVPVDFLNNQILRNVSSNGGLYVGQLSIARAVSGHLALGIGLDWLFGRANFRRSLDFSDAAVINNLDAFNDRYSVFRPTFGLLAGIKNTDLGCSLTLPATVNVAEVRGFQSGYSSTSSFALKYPVGWRLGISQHLTRRFMIGADIEFEGWNSSDLSMVAPATAADQWRFSLGAELLPAAVESPKFYRTQPLRVGFSQVVYPYKLDGFRTTERIYSIGTGRYFGQNNGLIDLAFEILRRSTDAPGYPDENVFRVAVSLSAFERWVPRPRRK